MGEAPRSATRRDAITWAAVLALLGAALVARNLIGLDAAPPGMYVDEASIGYNAWTVAHYGVDEHGSRLPLYFQAFGEYKNPVYIYALAAFLRLLPLTPAVERVPAALFGMGCVAFIVLTAWRLSRSRWIVLITLLIAGFTPWLTQQSRVGFEVISMVACLCVAVWCLSGSEPVRPRRFLLAGIFLAAAVLAYSAGRVEVILFSAALAVWFRRHPRWWLALLPIAAMYLLVGAWAAVHPGALTAEFSVVNIGADHAALPVLLARFISNYAQYFSPDFLFVHGDPNLRHNTGYTGMLLALMGPLLLAGLWYCWRNRERALPCFALTCLLLAPVSGALTYPAPHALRGAGMIPFLFVLCVYGMVVIRDVAPSPRWKAAALATAAGLCVLQGSLYTGDLFGSYPSRAASSFDEGVLQAVRAAKQAAGAHQVFLSDGLDEQPYIDGLMALTPPPPTSAVATSGSELQGLAVAVVPASAPGQAAQPGDVLVLSATDPPPRNAELLATESAPGTAAAAAVPLVRVYRVR